MTHLANLPVNNSVHLRCISQNLANPSGLRPAVRFQRIRAKNRASNALAAAVPTIYLPYRIQTGTNYALPFYGFTSTAKMRASGDGPYNVSAGQRTKELRHFLPFYGFKTPRYLCPNSDLRPTRKAWGVDRIASCSTEMDAVQIEVNCAAICPEPRRDRAKCSKKMQSVANKNG